MSEKRDARAEVPSSGSPFARALARCDRFAGPAFAAFVLLHLALEAVRAHADDALARAGLEATPALVLFASIVIVIPFAIFATRTLKRRLAGERDENHAAEARALSVLELVALCVVLPFLVLHAWQFAWPLVHGDFEASDVRAELVSSLSNSSFGLPLVGTGYALAVAAASFFGTREVLRAGRGLHVGARRALVSLGVLAYLLGSYAVIRGAGGPFSP